MLEECNKRTISRKVLATYTVLDEAQKGCEMSAQNHVENIRPGVAAALEEYLDQW